MQDEEAGPSPRRYPSLAWWIVLVLTAGAVVLMVATYERMHREEVDIRSVSIPTYPQASGWRDQTRGRWRGIVFHAPATYPQQDVLEFYKRSFTARDGWEVDRRSAVDRSKWQLSAVAPLMVMGEGTLTRKPSRGPTRLYIYEWHNRAKDVSANLSVIEDVPGKGPQTEKVPVQRVMLVMDRDQAPAMGFLAMVTMLGTVGLEWLIGIFLLGTIGGSVINTLAYRLPRRQAILRWPECPECGSPRKAIEMVPIVGWLVSFGRCRSNGERIGMRHPVVEALGGVILCTAMFGGVSWIGTPLLYLACAALLVALLVEMDRTEAPAKVYWVVGGAAVLLDGWHIYHGGLRWMPNFPFQHGAQTIIVSLPRSLAGAAIGAAAMLALAALVRVVSGRWGLLSDVKVAAVVGALVATVGYSPKWPVVAVALAAVIGLIVWLAGRGPEARPSYLRLTMLLAGLIGALAPAVLMMVAPTLTNTLFFGW